MNGNDLPMMLGRKFAVKTAVCHEVYATRGDAQIYRGFTVPRKAKSGYKETGDMAATLIVTQEDFTSRLISDELSSEFPSTTTYAEPSVSRAVRRMESREIDLMLFDLQLASSASLEAMERVSTSTAMQAIFFGACSGCPADRRLIQIISRAGHISSCSSFGSEAAALDVGRGGSPVIVPSVCGRFTEDREYA